MFKGAGGGSDSELFYLPPSNSEFWLEEISRKKIVCP